MKAFIFLENDIDAFRLDKIHIKKLQETFPDWEFTHVYSENELVLNLPECELLVTWYFKPQWYKLAPNLLAIFTPAAGHDWISRKEGIPVFYGSFHGQIMAESLLSMILFFNRKIGASICNQSKHIWERNHLSATHSLNFQHVLIFGFGSIGRACATILKGFGCKVTGVKRSAYDPLTDKCADNIISPQNIDTALSEADHVVSFLPGNIETNNFFEASVFEKMKPSAYFYCFGRGNCFNENDLVWCLKNKIIAGAALDVFPKEPLDRNSPLWDLPNVLITPHGVAICSEYLLMYLNDLINQLKKFETKDS